MIKRDEFETWRANPITQALHAYCQERVDGLMQEWADASLTSDALWIEDRARFLRTEILAKVQTLQAIIEADFADEEEDDDDDER